MNGAPGSGPDELAALHQRLEALRQVHEQWAVAEAAKVVYLPTTWGIDPEVQRAAEYAVAVAARELGLGFTPRVKWFRQGGPLDRETDHPEGFRDRPGIVGFADPADGRTVWLNIVYCRCPPGAVEPSLQEVCGHEVAHLQQFTRPRAPGAAWYELRERMATLTAQALTGVYRRTG